MVWGCFSHDRKLDLKVVRKTLTGQRYINDILEPIVCPHFRAHQAARPIFQDDNAHPHRAHIVTDSLAQEGIENLQWLSRSPDMNPIEYAWDVTYSNEMTSSRLMTLYVHLSTSGTFGARFLRKLVQGMPRRARELHQRRGGYTRY